jgi:uncharacterized protein (TIGR01777 family)
MSDALPIVVITGGSGMVGRRLSRLLLSKGYHVRWLVRNTKHPEPGVEVFSWNPSRAEMDVNALRNVHTLINLAGAGIADKPWTNSRKKEILLSRTTPIALLQQKMQEEGLQIPNIICASASGYYMPGKVSGMHSEEEQHGSGFLADCCHQWEEASHSLRSCCKQFYIVRIGIVLSNKGGALPVMRLPFRFGLGSALGNGKQAMPWIHEDDLSGIFLHLLQNNPKPGVYNAVAPACDNNLSFGKALASAMHKPFFMPPVPAFLLRLLKGEMADMVLQGSPVSAQKILDTGFVFIYPNLAHALPQLEASKAEGN